MKHFFVMCVLCLSLNASADVVVNEYPVGGKPVVVIQPSTGGPFPVIYALSGLGEMRRGPRAAAHGWVEKYGLVEAMRAVSRGRISSDDFMGLVQGAMLKQYQTRLERPFRGVVVVCPAVPRKLSLQFTQHLINELIPWAEANLPIMKGARHRGIDGISLGGRHALQIALKHPALFKSIGSEQAAVRGLSKRWQRALKNHPGNYKHLHVNLLTSTHDGFRKSIAHFAGILSKGPLTVRHQITNGRHDKRFAKGPASIDMLLFHEAVLYSSP
ncbi:MAG TPA: hypothetical protein EYN06_07680 [Myxococcales bacterium]|nr:hypothetical protein [Myxococcales bacterium]